MHIIKKGLIIFYVIIICIGNLFSQRVQVGILIFDGVQIIDFTGPYETFGQAGYNVFTISENGQQIKSNMGLNVIPDFSFENAPDIDILVLPGGRVAHHQERTSPVIKWIIKIYPDITNILTVCNGVFFLGPTSILKNQAVTTNAGMLDHLPHFIENIIPVKDERVVKSGKVISSGGLSAGIDGALEIVSLLNSKGRAQEIANQMEYNWDPDHRYVRYQLADMELSKILDTNPPLRKETRIYEGDSSQWTAVFQVSRSKSITEFSQELSRIAQAYNWELKNYDENEISRNYKWVYYSGSKKCYLEMSLTLIEKDLFDLSIDVLCL